MADKNLMHLDALTEMKAWVHEGFSAVEMVNNGGYF